MKSLTRKLSNSIRHSLAIMVALAIAISCNTTAFAAEAHEDAKMAAEVVVEPTGNILPFGLTDEELNAITPNAARTSIISNGSVTWNQVSYPAYVIADFNATRGQTVSYSLVANARLSSNFKVKLQKKGFAGIWSNTGSIWTFNQHSGGAYNSAVWPVESNGEYRIVMEDCNDRQEVGLSRINLSVN